MRRWQQGKNGKRKVHVDKFGRKLKSGLEVRVSEALGRTWAYEARKLPYTLSNTYTPDFSKGLVSLEVKGRFTGTDRRKMLAVKVAHPDLDIRLILMRDNPLYKGAKSRYSDWCKKHEFPFSIYPRLPI